MARWYLPGNTYSSTPIIVIGQELSITTLTIDEPIIEGKPLVFRVAVRMPLHPTGGAIVSIRDTGLDQVVATIDLQHVDHATLVDGVSGSEHTFVAEYPGTGGTPLVILPSTSAPVTIDPDEDTTIEAEAATASATKFYPARDGYKDWMTTQVGLRERLSDRVEVWSVATGQKIRTLVDDPEYRRDWADAAWDGTTLSGALAPSGLYKFVHVLADPWGNTSTVETAPFALSQKRLEWHTISTATKQGRSFELKRAVDGGTAKTSTSAYNGGLRLKRGRGYAGVVYNVPMSKVKAPSNAVLKKVIFSVHGKGISGGRAVLALYNETRGEYYFLSSYDERSSTTSTYKWHSTSSMSASAHIDGRNVYGLVEAIGTFDINDVKVTVKYAILK